MVTSLSEVPSSQFAQHIFGAADLGDRRRGRRAVRVAGDMLARPGLSFCALYASSWGNCKAAYSLMAHEAVTPGALLGSHFEAVRGAMPRDGTEVLLIEDTSEIDYPGRKRIEGLSRVGPGSPEHQGFLLHSVIAAVPGGEPAEGAARPPLRILGFAHQEYFLRSEKAPERKKRSYEACEDRESQLFERSTMTIGPAPEGARFVRVVDRGGDIYLSLARYQEAGHHFVVRAKFDRPLEEGSGRTMSEALEKAPWSGESFRIELRARPGQAARTASLRVRMAPVSIAPGRFSAKARKRLGVPLEPIRCTVLHILEDEATAPKEPAQEPARLRGTKLAKRATASPRLEWKLLVSWPLENFEAARRAAAIYAMRWIIEEFHRTLKEGMGAERLQMETGHSLMNTVALMCPLALRVVDLRERARLAPGHPAASTGLTPTELKVLEAAAKRPVRTVEDAARAIGQLGGHLGRKGDGMPGARTLFLGLRRLQHLVEGFLLYESLHHKDAGRNG